MRGFIIFGSVIMETYDILIVGGGMAGCILATRIAEHGIHPRTGEPLKVAMIERGPYFKGDPKPGFGIPLRRKMFTDTQTATYPRDRLPASRPAVRESRR